MPWIGGSDWCPHENTERDESCEWCDDCSAEYVEKEKKKIKQNNSASKWDDPSYLKSR